MRSLPLLLLVALAALGESKGSSKHHGRVKRESLIRSKRRWVLSTVELQEEMNVKYPYNITRLHNMKVVGKDHRFSVMVESGEDGLFSIDETTGDVFVHRRLDREKKSFHQIRFHVTEKASNKEIDKELFLDVAILDINDNAPKFNKLVKEANVKENIKSGEYLPISMEITDEDQEDTINSAFEVTVAEQTPAEPKIRITNVIGNTYQLTFEGCFDYDKAKQYSVVILASDKGKPALSSSATITLNVIDTNSHQPKFKKTQYQAEAMEMTLLKEILRIAVDDMDTPGTPGWKADYYFISGNEDGMYNITTDPITNEGIIGITKEKNFDRTSLVKLQIGVKNPETMSFCKDGKLITDSSQLPPPDSVNITVRMNDTNDPPEFKKYTDEVHHKEESEPGKSLYTPKVHDVDSSNIRFELIEDPADWVTVDKKTGQITTIKKMDRESPFVDEKNIYRIVVVAIDDGTPPATSTFTLKVHIMDKNDNTPMLVNKKVLLCRNLGDKVTVPVKDADADPYSGPFFFSLANDETKWDHWELESTHGEQVILVIREKIPYGNYSVPLEIQDKQNHAAKETLGVEVCDCDESGVCSENEPPFIVLDGTTIGPIIAGLLAFLLLLAIFVCNRGREFTYVDMDEGHQTLVKYNEEGGGSDCKIERLILTPEGLGSVTDGMKISNIQTAPGVLNGNGAYSTATFNMNSNMNIMESMQKRALRNSIRVSRGNSTFNHSMRLVQDFINTQITRVEKEADIDTSYPIDYSLTYAEEGTADSCHQSLEQLPNDDQDLKFLVNLEPQFKTLGNICKSIQTKTP
ncbi:cadherin-like protein 26 [Fundulus heteroclitus]|uniref:cadherin-like protein 26 n=1 Tax=Fundulus heteroclitus TaxID=8078 RepID=UPI00165ABF59|nr:cadherin-like protein 26 [Fundulus heteroclitus]